ncbi:2-dehydro-3-deoxyphosphooctonate aldolase [Chryseobacterium wangxinyae]|uniref:2-dehydro-3-deoxyphosphooctonate aldolase n=1 Tax=Chryseobacterium sp. CY350 TaxID=2997336 RepID=UPI00226E0C3C|nr:2-dehydro-3-deoxyphosphooctonate aldolase [Chryseobacterium sp. CY350]MCY0978456.1 2-dehydro-3-deoxyphosphooctonate aldolase [Chryseobacterium sp. CY350]WBZ96228.1 2-dehydro-3-deoxyphosphooctonate aldolase [Chryseobacterium sp. CY350]
MKKLLFIPLLLFALSSCGTANTSSNKILESSKDSTYGFTEKNPIKVGGIGSGPHNERNYLNSLTGPNGEKVSYERRGSCCEFKSHNSPFGMGLLDKYAVTYEGKNDTVTVYLNMYDKAQTMAPLGFKINK